MQKMRTHVNPVDKPIMEVRAKLSRKVRKILFGLWLEWPKPGPWDRIIPWGPELGQQTRELRANQRDRIIQWGQQK